MTELNVMMREHARAGLQTQLDAAVTNGDTEAARKITADLEKLAVSTAPKAAPYGDTEIRAELDKQPWFGTDPKKSAKAMEFGKTMDPKKFATAEAFATAIVKAVDDEFKPAGTAAPAADDDDDGDGEGEPGDDEGADGAGEKKPAGKRRTDGPGESDATQRTSGRSSTKPWAKLSEAPADVQKEVNRTADKFAPKTKEGRAAYVARALEAHYAQHQRNKPRK